MSAAAANAQRLFAEAEAAFGAGRFAEARAHLDTVERLVPPHPAVLHLSGLVHRRLGDPDTAAATLARARQLAPQDARIANAHGNALADAGDGSGSVEAYLAAERLDPRLPDAPRNLALSLIALGRGREAVAAAQRAVAIDGTHSPAWSTLGQALRAAGRLDQAAEAFDRALALAPALASAQVGRARVALERGEADAGERHRAALTASPTDRELLLGLAQAEPTDAAMDRLRDRLRSEPEWIEGHRTFARLASERNESVDSTFCDAQSQRPADPLLATERLIVLVKAERESDALSLIQRLPNNVRDQPPVRRIEALAATLIGDISRARVAIAAIRDSHPEFSIEPLAMIALADGDPAAAAALLERHVGTQAETVSYWALLSLAWRLLEDDREEWLHGQPGLIAATDMDLSPADLDAILALLRDLHAGRRAHPVGQSMRGGTQTSGRLFARTEPVLRRLAETLSQSVEIYRAALPPLDPAHPVLRHRNRPWMIAKSWSVRLTGAGFHVHHVHPEGVVSSAAYLHLPKQDAAADPHSGWLALGASPAHLRIDLPPVRLIEPKVGRLALFPSTLYHGTVPFDAGERLTVAFDVTPGT